MVRARSVLILATGLAGSMLLVRCAAPESAIDEGVPLPPRRGEPGAPVDAGSEASTGPCDRSQPFGSPMRVPGFASRDEYRGTPKLSPDERTIYFTELIQADGSFRAQLAFARRASRDEAFGPSTRLDRLNSAFEDYDPSVTHNELGLLFVSTRSGNADLWFATRTKPADEFGDPTPVHGVNTPTMDMHPYLRVEAGELWFASDRADAGFRIYVAQLPAEGGAFGEARMVKELVTGINVAQPSPTEDGLRIVFAAESAQAGAWDLWASQRASTLAPFSAPTLLAELNSPREEYAGWLSPDGCRVYFSSDRDTDAAVPGHRLWYAARPATR